MTTLPTLRLRAVTQFPVSVTGGNGLAVTRSGGEWSIDPDFSTLDEMSSVTDSGNAYIWIYNASTGEYNKATLLTVISDLSASGAGISIPYTVSVDTTDADPGDGKLKFNNATQSSATYLYIDLLDYFGVTQTTAIDSVVDGDVSITKVGDQTKRLVYSISSVTTATGYRKIAVTNLSASASIPFIDGDLVLLQLARKGAAGSGNVTSTLTFGLDNVIVRADGTSRNVQATGIAVDDSNNVSGVGTLATTGAITSVVDNSTNNDVSRLLVLRHTTSGTPATGIGTGIQFDAESAAGTVTAASADIVATDVTAASEDFDFVVNLMAAGSAAAEKFRVTSTGIAKVGGSYTLLPSNGAVNLTGGFTATSYNAGTYSTGTFTPDPTLGNIQHYTNNGAHTLAPPSSVCTMIIQLVNGASAGTVTTSGFTKVNGDTLNTTSGKAFELTIRKLNGYSMLTVQAIN